MNFWLFYANVARTEIEEEHCLTAWSACMWSVRSRNDCMLRIAGIPGGWLMQQDLGDDSCGLNRSAGMQFRKDGAVLLKIMQGY